MRKLSLATLLLLLVGVGHTTWCEEIPTAPEVPAEGSIDVQKASIPELKKWLRRDAKGRLLSTQILLLGTRWWKKPELLELFGKANENALGEINWYPRLGYEGIVVITDNVLPGDKPILLSIGTGKSPQKDLLELTVIELGPAD